MAPILWLIWFVRSSIVLLGTDLRRILVTGYMRMAYEDHIDSDANLNSHPTLKVQLANYMVSVSKIIMKRFVICRNPTSP